MKERTRKRLYTFIALAILTPLGFYTKLYDGPGGLWVSHSLGGALYVVFWCLVAHLIFSSSAPWKIALWVFIITSGLEFLQLWNPPALEMLRSGFIGRTVLGNSFNRMDFPYYLAGSVAGWLLMLWINRISASKEG